MKEKTALVNDMLVILETERVTQELKASVSGVFLRNENSLRKDSDNWRLGMEHARDYGHRQDPYQYNCLRV